MVLAVTALVVLGAMYFVPSLLAIGSRRFAAIFVINLSLGWTLLGWVFALVFALLPEDR